MVFIELERIPDNPCWRVVTPPDSLPEEFWEAWEQS
jgi:hypothetical protein